ncbi:MAG: N-acetylmuramoyl-L-alanine amidase [Gemmatimonadales bacterium]
MARTASPFISTLLLVLAAAPGLQAQGRAAPPPPPLPAIPLVQGPLGLAVAYPPANTQIGSSDSNFIFGQTGNGKATLTVNGERVEVYPDGAWLAWLPLPNDTIAVYHIVARLGADSAVLDHRVRLPHRFVPPAGIWIDRASLEPRGNRWTEPGELIRVSLRAARGADVSLHLPGGVVLPLAPDTGSRAPVEGPFVRLSPRPGEQDVTRYAGVFAATQLGAALPPVTTPRVPAWAPGCCRAASDSGAWITAAIGPDTAREALPLRLALLDPARRAVVVLDDDTARTGYSRGAAVGRPLPGGTFEWFFRNGTVAAISARTGDELRVQLTRQAAAWVGIADVAGTLPVGTPPPSSRVGLVRLAPGDSSVVARISLASRIPFKVDETDRALTLHLYGGRADLDWLQYGGTDPLVRRMSFAQPAEDEATVTFELSRPVFGYRADWQGTDLLLTIRRAPAINRLHPLKGRIIAVDPGHPPLGAMGPTGLKEADANLGVARALQRMLERAGALVVMTRTTDTALGLYERTTIAERAGAELLVSIHNNALPDGVNPFENNGTSAYYFQPRAVRLAMLVQDAMVRRLGLPNLGVGRGDLALARPTWMPSLLCEGAFLMIPAQENALRTPSFQDRYARGVMEGIEAWFRELASQ